MAAEGFQDVAVHLCTHGTEMDRKDGFQKKRKTKEEELSISVLSLILYFLKVCKSRQ